MTVLIGKTVKMLSVTDTIKGTDYIRDLYHQDEIGFSPEKDLMQWHPVEQVFAGWIESTYKDYMLFTGRTIEHEIARIVE